MVRPGAVMGWYVVPSLEVRLACLVCVRPTEFLPCMGEAGMLF